MQTRPESSILKDIGLVGVAERFRQAHLHINGLSFRLTLSKNTLLKVKDNNRSKTIFLKKRDWIGRIQVEVSRQAGIRIHLPQSSTF